MINWPSLMRWHFTDEEAEASGRFFAQGHTASLSWMILETLHLTSCTWPIADAQQMGERNIRIDEPTSEWRGEGALNEAPGKHSSSPAGSALLSLYFFCLLDISGCFWQTGKEKSLCSRTGGCWVQRGDFHRQVICKAQQPGS